MSVGPTNLRHTNHMQKLFTTDDASAIISDPNNIETVATWMKQVSLEIEAEAAGDEDLAEAYFQLRKQLWPQAVRTTFVILTLEDIGEGHFVSDMHMALHELADELGPIVFHAWTRLCRGAMETYRWV